MGKAEKGKLEKAVGAYFKEIHQIYTGGDFREESFYPALKMLIEKCSQLTIELQDKIDHIYRRAY